ncbi:MAG: hypothetical protein OXP12_05375 [Thaumarchaeota archaeon]|nr:hypothetical protein [Nitrososphaerota archaeon]
MQTIIGGYDNAQKWSDAPLGKIKTLSNGHIGDIGQDFVKKWCDALDLAWKEPDQRQSPWDVKIKGISFEVKTATEDVGGAFQFNHIRHHREYQGLLCLGISPDNVLFNMWRKGDLAEGLAGRLVTMDKGSSATFKLTKKPEGLLPISQFESKLDEIMKKYKVGSEDKLRS